MVEVNTSISNSIFFRDLTKDGVVKLMHYGLKDQIVDIITKSLKLELFLRMRELLGICLLGNYANSS